MYSSLSSARDEPHRTKRTPASMSTHTHTHATSPNIESVKNGGGEARRKLTIEVPNPDNL